MRGIVVEGQFTPFRQLSFLPEGYPGPTLRTSTIFFVKGTFGKITLQRLVSGPFEIWHGVYEAHRDCSIRFHHKRAFLGVHALLSGDINHAIAGLPAEHYAARQCNFYFLPVLDGTLHLLKGGKYQSLDICIRAQQVKSYLTHFPSAKLLKEKLFQKTTGSLHAEAVPMDYSLQSIVQEILRFNGPIDQQDLFIRIKVHEFLFHLFGLNHPTSDIKPEYKDRLQLAYQFITANFTQHMTIRQLSKMAGMNTTSFKSGFKKAYGMAPFEYLVEVRMQHAIELLQKRDLSIQRVADDTGYKSFASFIKAFKKRFGSTPGQIKKNFPIEPS
jgi:AraC-like DNA-binding protein